MQAVRQVLVGVRYFWFARVRHRLSTFGSHQSVPGTVEHNLTGILMIGQRAAQLLSAVSMVEATRGGRCLIIGCRNEDDLFVAKGYGFGSVTGLDLISYSPHVRVGDMHDLPFPDDSFDAVVVPYTLSYSNRPALAAAEFARACRAGGVIGIAIEYLPAQLVTAVSNVHMHEAYQPYEPRIDSAAELLALFDPAVVDSVVVRYDALGRRHHTVDTLVRDPSPIIVVFTVKKDG